MDYSAVKGYDCDCCCGIDTQINRHNILIRVPFRAVHNETERKDDKPGH
ncbi:MULTISPECIES: hypothetical protein [Limnospira]|nr:MULTISPECIES: hypothetical protein [unclassified Limnospira]